VKVLSKGPQVFDVLFALNDAVLNDQYEKVGITNFDITLITTGSGKDTKVTPIPHPEKNEPTPEGLELNDLSKVVIKLDPSEMMDLQHGASLRDIFAARKASAPVDTTVVSDETTESVQADIKKLFDNPELQ
jgi:hypothetical protein